MNIKSILMASTVVVLAGYNANAADAIVYEEPAPVVVAPVFSWAGGYVGGQIGYGWASSKFSGEDGSEKVKPDGFLGGLYAGYNFDTGSNFIFGIDGDVTFNGLKKTVHDTDEFLGDDSLESKLRTSGAVRARVGIAYDRFLPYLAGGVAFGEVKNRLTIDGETYSHSKTRTGWTVGGGFDYAATDNVIMRLEYRYTDYGRKDFAGTVDGLDFNSRNKFTVNEVRLGVAYKF
ncbi:outer membrane protein [Paenochrobactrum sp. BZR 588]|uniref:outer membrane protein n=1 Tax=Paenochrobactrum TaxID=999488 RepID=UPI0035BC2753